MRDSEFGVERPFRATFVARNRRAWVQRDKYSADKLSCAWSARGVSPVFEADKIVQESHAESLWPTAGHLLKGYEIHHRRTFSCASRGEALARGGCVVGWRCERAVGIYLHGILGSDAWRSAFLNQVRRSRGFPAQGVQTNDPVEHRIRRWAEHVRHHLRPGAWERILGVFRP